MRRGESPACHGRSALVSPSAGSGVQGFSLRTRSPPHASPEAQGLSLGPGSSHASVGVPLGPHCGGCVTPCRWRGPLCQPRGAGASSWGPPPPRRIPCPQPSSWEAIYKGGEISGRGYKCAGRGRAPQEQPPGRRSRGQRCRDEHQRAGRRRGQWQQQQQVGLGLGARGPWRLARARARSPPTHPTRSSQASCGLESSGSERAPAAPAPRILRGLLGSDDEEQEDAKDYCKGEACLGAARGEGPGPAHVGRAPAGRAVSGTGKATPPPRPTGSLPQVATTP